MNEWVAYKNQIKRISIYSEITDRGFGFLFKF